jgi:hypothetical protein
MKQLVKKIPHKAREKTYEIEIYSDGADWEARGTLNGNQVTPDYSVKQVVDMDMRFYRGEWAHDHLEGLVKGDIDEGRVAA